MQVGSRALSLEGVIKWARFGPFLDLCFTSPSACTDGFTVVFWIKMLFGCDGFIMSTIDSIGCDGFQMSCDVSRFRFEIVVGGSTSQTSVSVSLDMWVRVIIAGNIPGSITIRLDHIRLTVSGSGSQSNPSTTQQVVFGRQWVTTSGNNGFGKALIDDVRIYNNQSAANEIWNEFKIYSAQEYAVCWERSKIL